MLGLSGARHWDVLVRAGLVEAAEGTCGWEGSEVMETEPTLRSHPAEFKIVGPVLYQN